MMAGMVDDVFNTIPQLLAATVARKGDQPALGTISAGQLRWRTWAEIARDVHRFIATLQLAGVEAGDRVAQWAPNSYGWIVTDLAVLSLGAVHVPLHTSASPEQITEFFDLAAAKLLIVDDANGRPGLRGISQLSHTELAADTEVDTEIDAEAWSIGDEASSVSDNVEPHQLATLLFTSGTTGQPRGVMLSHENLASNAIATTEAVGSASDETRLCFLPLSHIYARTCDLYSWIYCGSRIVLAESRDTIVRDCQLVRPNVLNGVPYFYQKIAQQLTAADEPQALQNLLGGQLQCCFCGGAAVAPEVEAFFERQGLPLLSGYGLTETSPVVSATALDGYQPGIVGRPLPNVEVKISATGEILVRGPNVMLGYWNDSIATEQAIVEGWLQTGDLGEFDSAGNLRIVGRQKEVLVLSTGKNVSPSRVEQHLVGSPWVEHACVIGEGRKCLGALIVPNPDTLRREIRKRRLWIWSRRRAVTHPQIRELFRAEINRLLASLSDTEQVGCFTILDRNFSLELGELTPKLSLRRATIGANFSRQIEQMYAR